MQKDPLTAPGQTVNGHLTSNAKVVLTLTSLQPALAIWGTLRGSSRSLPSLLPNQEDWIFGETTVVQAVV